MALFDEQLPPSSFYTPPKFGGLSGPAKLFYNRAGKPTTLGSIWSWTPWGAAATRTMAQEAAAKGYDGTASALMAQAQRNQQKAGAFMQGAQAIARGVMGDAAGAAAAGSQALGSIGQIAASGPADIAQPGQTDSYIPAFDDGGKPKPTYNTRLAPAQEAAYRAWMKKIGHTPERGFNVDKNLTGIDYDYRGYFKRYGATALGEGQHLTDEYKKPTHPSFSNESVYFSPATRDAAGHWEGDMLVPFNPARRDTMVDKKGELLRLKNGQLLPAFDGGGKLINGEPILMTDQRTDQPVGTMKYGEGIFDQKATQDMEQLALSKQYDKLGKYVAREMKTWPEATGIQAHDEGGYVVKKGDTLSAIARRINTTAGALAQANGIQDVNKIRAGMRLNFSAAPSPAHAQAAPFVPLPPSPGGGASPAGPDASGQAPAGVGLALTEQGPAPSAPEIRTDLARQATPYWMGRRLEKFARQEPGRRAVYNLSARLLNTAAPAEWWPRSRARREADRQGLYGTMQKQYAQAGSPAVMDVNTAPGTVNETDPGRAFYNSDQRAMYVRPGRARDYFAELAHATQQAGGRDMHQDWKTPTGQEAERMMASSDPAERRRGRLLYDQTFYSQAGSVENEAHGLIQPRLVAELPGVGRAARRSLSGQVRYEGVVPAHQDGGKPKPKPRPAPKPARRAPRYPDYDWTTSTEYDNLPEATFNEPPAPQRPYGLLPDAPAPKAGKSFGLAGADPDPSSPYGKMTLEEYERELRAKTPPPFAKGGKPGPVPLTALRRELAQAEARYNNRAASFNERMQARRQMSELSARIAEIERGVTEFKNRPITEPGYTDPAVTLPETVVRAKRPAPVRKAPSVSVAPPRLPEVKPPRLLPPGALVPPVDASWASEMPLPEAPPATVVTPAAIGLRPKDTPTVSAEAKAPVVDMPPGNKKPVPDYLGMGMDALRLGTGALLATPKLPEWKPSENWQGMVETSKSLAEQGLSEAERAAAVGAIAGAQAIQNAAVESQLGGGGNAGAIAAALSLGQRTATDGALSLAAQDAGLRRYNRGLYTNVLAQDTAYDLQNYQTRFQNAAQSQQAGAALMNAALQNIEGRRNEALMNAPDSPYRRYLEAQIRAQNASSDALRNPAMVDMFKQFQPQTAR